MTNIMEWQCINRQGISENCCSVVNEQFAGALGLRVKSARTVITLACFYLVLVSISLFPGTSLAVDIQFNQGFNLFSYPTIPEGNLTCSQLQMDFGTDRIQRLDSQGQLFEDCESFDFPILSGEGYIVDMNAGVTISIDGEFSCPEIDLAAGVNLVGVPTPIPGLNCFELLNSIGNVNVAAIQRFNIQTGLFETCMGDFESSAPTGNDFTIRSGEGYLLHMKNGLSGFNINELDKCTPAVELSCQSMSPTKGPVDHTVTLRGTGFVANSTQVSFNGLMAAVINQTETRLDVQIPAGNASGPVVIDLDTDGSSAQCGDFTLNEAPTLDPIGNRTVTLGQQIMFDVSGSDPENDPLTFNITPLPLPVGASFNANTGEFMFRPVAQQADQCFTLTFSASDGQLESSETLDLCVESVQQTTLSGSILSTTDLCPLEGIMVTAGLDSGPQATATTDASGRYTLLLDTVHTDADGLTPLKVDATSPNVVRHCSNGDTPLNQTDVPDLPLIREAVRLLPDAANLINCEPGRLCIDGERPILMPVLAIAEGTKINPTQDQMVQSPVVGICEADNLGFSKHCNINGDAVAQCGAGRACIATNTIELAVESGSALDATTCTNPNDNSTCQPFTGTMSLTPVPNERSPVDLPEEFDFSVYMAVQPFNVKFDPPQPICFPNVEDFPSGSKLDVFAMDSDSGEFIQLGTGTVCGRTGDPNIPASTNPMCSIDKSLMCSDGGIVRFGSWHGIVPQDPQENQDDDSGNNDGGDPPDCPGSGVCMRTGNLRVEHKLVRYKSSGANRGIRLNYNSLHAYPTAYISRFWTPGNTAPPPVNITTSIKLGNIDVDGEIFYSPDFCTRLSCPFGRFARAADATVFTTGVYPAELTLSCNFPMSRRIESHSDNLAIINEIDNPVGAGWSVSGLDRIFHTVTGDLLLTNGDIEPLVFTPALRIASGIDRIGEQDVYRFAANAGEVISIRMNRRSNLPDGSSSLDPALEIRDSRGFVVAENDDGGTTAVNGPGANAAVDGLILPTTDTYTVITHGVGGTTGTYDLLFTIATDTPIVEGQFAAPDTVQPGITFNGDVQAGGTATHTFTANVGTTVSVEINRDPSLPDGSGTLDPAVEIRDSRGFLLVGDDDTGSDIPPGPGRNALIPSIVLPATDTYTLSITGSGSTSGSYSGRVVFGNISGSIEFDDTSTTTVEQVIVSPPGDSSTLIEIPGGEYERFMMNGTRKRYNANGLLTVVESRNSNLNTFEYDVSDRLIAVTDAVGLVTSLRYDADTGSAANCQQALDEIEDPAGRITKFIHDAECNLLEIIDPDGAKRRFEYDNRHFMLRKTSARGITTSDPDDFTTSYEYNQTGRVVRSQLSAGVEREYAAAQSLGLHGAPGDCDQVPGTPGCPDNLLPVKTQSELDITYRDRELRTMSIDILDSLGNTLSLTDPLGHAFSITRDPRGNPTQITSPANDTTEFTYDDQSRVTKVVDGNLGTVTTLGYDSATGLISEVVDNSGGVTHLVRNPSGNITQIVSPMGKSIDATYSPTGRIENVTIAGLEANIEYDSLGRILRLRRGSLPNERITTFSRTQAGEIESIADPLSRTVSFEYDGAGRVTRQLLPAGNMIVYDYDEAGNLAALTPPGRPPHQFKYDERGNLSQLIPPVVGPFDPTTTFTYNLENQLKNVELPGGRTMSFNYDAAGQVLSLQIPRGIYQITRDPLSGLASTITSPDGITSSYSYKGSRETAEQWSGSINGIVSWIYDQWGRLASQSINNSDTITFGYDDDGYLVLAGALSLEKHPLHGLLTGSKLGKVNTFIEYNAFLEKTDDSAIYNNDVLYANVYMHDDLSRIIHVSETIQNEATILEFNYNSTGRLEEVRRNGTIASSYSYDANGNRITETTSSGTFVSAYDAQDRLLSRGDEKYAYSEIGDLIEINNSVTGDRTTYDYDSVGNLISVMMSDGREISYIIDSRNRRVGKKINGVLQQGFLYKDQRNPVTEMDGSGNVVSRFVYGTKINVPDYMFNNGNIYRILSDRRGSPRLVINVDTGTVMQRLDYDEYGNVLQDTNPGFQPFGFAGGIFDIDTKLVHFDAREYDAHIGQWTAKDPGGFSSNGRTNLYEYASGDPVNRVDITGTTYMDEEELEREADVHDTVGTGATVIGLGATIICAVVTSPTGVGPAICTGIAIGTGVGSFSENIRENNAREKARELRKVKKQRNLVCVVNDDGGVKCTNEHGSTTLCNRVPLKDNAPICFPEPPDRGESGDFEPDEDVEVDYDEICRLGGGCQDDSLEDMNKAMDDQVEAQQNDKPEGEC